MLTSRGITLLSGSVLAWLAGRALGIAELHVVAAATALLVGLGVAHVRLSSGAVAVRRLVAHDRLLAGSPLDVVLELRNDGRVRTPALLVEDAVPPALATARPRAVVADLAVGAVAQVPQQLTAAARGRHELGPATVRLTDPFGVAERTRRYTTTDRVLVYPRVEHLPPVRPRGSHMGTGASESRRVSAVGEDFYTMREYVRGDDLRHVHWPSTAHRQTLMVRQMEQPWQPQATVLLDVREAAHTAGPDGTLEAAVSAAATLVYHLADAGYAVRLLTDRAFGRDAPATWEAALEALAVLEPSPSRGLGPSLAATRGGEGLLAVVVGTPPGRDAVDRHPDLRALTTTRGFGQRLAVVVGTGTDPRTERTAGLLRASGWRASAHAPGRPLARAWDEVTAPPGRRAAVAGAGVVGP